MRLVGGALIGWRLVRWCLVRRGLVVGALVGRAMLGRALAGAPLGCGRWLVSLLAALLVGWCLSRYALVGRWRLRGCPGNRNFVSRRVGVCCFVGRCLSSRSFVSRYFRGCFGRCLGDRGLAGGLALGGGRVRVLGGSHWLCVPGGGDWLGTRGG